MINIHLPKIEEIRYFSKTSRATMNSITVTKLDGVNFDAEIKLEGYSIVQ